MQQAPDLALAEAEAAAVDADIQGVVALEAMALATAAQAALIQGDAANALPSSTRALELRDRMGGMEEDEADLFLTHARVLTALGRDAEATATLERGRARVEELARLITDDNWRQRFLEDIPAHRELLASR
jgi:hypothetical protein